MEVRPAKQQENRYNAAIKNLVLRPLQGDIIKRLGAAPDNKEAWLRAIEQAFTDSEYKESVNKGSDELASAQIENVADWHQKKIAQQYKQLFGLDIIPMLNDFQTQQFLQPIIKTNIYLIKSISPKLLDQVNDAYQNILQTEGFSKSSILNMLTGRFGVANSRAKLIARDQTSKTVGALAQYRNQQAGAQSYQWRTAEDERVRPTHAANDGKIFRWDQPPAETGHPGHDIQCRCVAIPVLTKFGG
jgi:SPP1 gp7 family putative phage head morphogenesis protein